MFTYKATGVLLPFLKSIPTLFLKCSELPSCFMNWNKLMQKEMEHDTNP